MDGVQCNMLGYDHQQWTNIPGKLSDDQTMSDLTQPNLEIQDQGNIGLTVSSSKTT